MKKFLKIDWVILITTIALIAIGIFTLYSLTSVSGTRVEFFKSEFKNQLIFGLIGLILSIFVFSISIIYFKFRFIGFLLFLLTTGVLIFTLVFGMDIRGVKRWITIGGSVTPEGNIVGGITIQPSEFAKIAIVLITSMLLSSLVTESGKQNLSKFKAFLTKYKYILLALLANLVILLLILAQKSLSVTLVSFSIIFVIFFAAQKNKFSLIFTLIAFFVSLVFSQTIFFELSVGIRIGLFLVIVLLYAASIYVEKLSYVAILSAAILGIFTGSIFLNFMWNHVLKDFQKDRIVTYLNPDPNKEAEGFQQYQSKMSIGGGQVVGHGFRQISDARLLQLPEPTTDFIFAIFAFKFGFIGSLIVIGLFIVLICRLIYLADGMNDRFSSLIILGVAGMITVQFFVNIGMNLGILPVGGTTLPFVSAGGSSLISMMMSIALCQNVIATNRIEKSIYRRQDNVMINGWNA